MIDVLEEQELLRHPLLYPYIYPIHIHYDQTDEDGLLSMTEVSNYLTRTPLPKQIRTPAARKADGFRKLLSLQHGATGLRRTSFCMISTENSIIVDPYRDIYKCYDEAGKEEYKIGDIREGQVRWFQSQLDTYLRRNVSTIEQCSTCSVALACGGECGALAKAKFHDYFTPYCNDTKPILLEAIKQLYQEQAIDNKLEHMSINLPNL